MYGTTKSFQESLEKAIELCQRAVALDEDSGIAHAYLGRYLFLNREYDKALAEMERAIALNPGRADIIFRYGQILYYSCRPKEAIPMLRKAIRFNPLGPPYYFSFLAGSLCNTGRFDEAASEYRKAIQRSPDFILAHVGLAITYISMGHEKEARAEVAEVLRINPKYSVDIFARASPFKDQSQTDKDINALRKVGLK